MIIAAREESKDFEIDNIGVEKDGKKVYSQ